MAEQRPPFATTNTVVIWLGALSIVAGKVGALVLCSIGAFQMTKAIGAGPDQFQLSKRFAIIGCGVAVAMLYGSFIVFAESLFMMWQTPMGQTSALGAFRYGGFIALIMIFVAMKE